MPTKIAKNSFHGGIDKDTAKKLIDGIKYSDGYNVSLSQDGSEKTLSSFYGTTVLNTLVASGVITANDNIHVMGMYEAICIIDSSEEKTALVFIYNHKSGSELFTVFAVKEDATTVYKLYEESVVLADTARFVDCVVYKEGGTSYAYFVDYEESMKKLPCVITPTGLGDGDYPSTGTTYSREAIFLLRTGFRGEVSDVDVRSGNTGDLLNGSYQFSLRLFNNTENKYTKWGLFTNPAAVGMGYSTTEQSYGGVGYVSDSDINLTLTFQEDYSSLYTHYQLAVIENINGGKGATLTAKVLQPETLSGVSETYNYATNKVAKELITVEEIVVDDAAIKAVKTLAVKNNRLLLGNVKYHPLDYDNGDPIIAATTAAINTRLTGGKAVAYRDPDNASNKVGHFRGELYRYGAVYEDEFGNFSRPKMLDFSAVTTNGAVFADWVGSSTSYVVGNTVKSSGIGYVCKVDHNSGTFSTDLAAGKWTTYKGDFEFPQRNDGTMGTLLEVNGDIQALALNIMGLKNHPSWAVGVHIVRVPRKKKVLFQTPLVPSILVQPAKAVGSYPDQRQDGGDELPDPLNVEATNPDGSFVPKNFYHVLPKSLLRFGDFYGTIPDGGTVISTVFTSDDPAGNNTFLLKRTTAGASYNMPTQVERVLYSDSSSNTYQLYVYLADGSTRVVVVGDAVTVGWFTRTTSVGGSWGTPETDTDVVNYDEAPLALDTTINDYKFEVESLNFIIE